MTHDPPSDCDAFNSALADGVLSTRTSPSNRKTVAAGCSENMLTGLAFDRRSTTITAMVPATAAARAANIATKFCIQSSAIEMSL